MRKGENRMATATSRKAAPDRKELAARQAAADKLIGIHRRLKKDFADIDALEAQLKASATGAQASFRIDFDKGDFVSVAPGHEAEFKGDVPVVQTEAWLALK